MPKNDQQNPIVKTILLIAAITLIILFSFNAPPDSGILGTLTAVSSGIFTTIKIIIGLLAAFVISIFFFVIIFSLSVAIISRADAGKVINSVFHRLIGKDVLPQRQPELQRALQGSAPEQELTPEAPKGVGKVIKDRVKGYLKSHPKTPCGIKRRLHDEFASLQSELRQMAVEIKGLKDGQRGDDMEATVEALRSNIDSLQWEFGDLKKGLDEVRKQLAEVVAAEKKQEEEAKETEEEARIFEYLSRETDRKKLAELTVKTVEQGMSYAEATNFIISNMSGEASSIVEAHPALTKKYIKGYREVTG